MIHKTMPMKNPPHPGEVLKDLCIEPLGETLTDIAEKLGVSRKILSDLVNGKRSLSLDMAIRISKAFGSTPDTWLRMQLNYDLARQEKHAAKIKVPRLVPKSEEIHMLLDHTRSLCFRNFTTNLADEPCCGYCQLKKNPPLAHNSPGVNPLNYRGLSGALHISNQPNLA